MNNDNRAVQGCDSILYVYKVPTDRRNYQPNHSDIKALPTHFAHELLSLAVDLECSYRKYKVYFDILTLVNLTEEARTEIFDMIRDEKENVTTLYDQARAANYTTAKYVGEGDADIELASDYMDRVLILMRNANRGGNFDVQ